MCSAGLNNLLISPYGDIYPCVGLQRKAGNLRQQALPDILHAPVFQQLRAMRFADLWACRVCDVAPYCRRCPGLAAAEDGDRGRQGLDGVRRVLQK